MLYQVHSSFGCSTFSTETDGIKAFWLLAPYHDIHVDEQAIKRALEKEGFYEAYPLSIVKCEA